MRIAPRLRVALALLGLVVLTATASELLHSTPVQAQSFTRGEPRFVGVSATERSGSATLAQLNADCVDEYEGSRVCTDVQIFDTFPAPEPGVDAWVVTTAAGATSTGALSPIGVVVSSYPNCANSTGRHFHSSTSAHDTLYLDSDGNFGLTSCSEEMVAACCRR